MVREVRGRWMGGASEVRERCVTHLLNGRVVLEVGGGCEDSLEANAPISRSTAAEEHKRLLELRQLLWSEGRPLGVHRLPRGPRVACGGRGGS